MLRAAFVKSLFVFLVLTSPSFASEACPRPEAFENAPSLQNLVDEVCSGIKDTLDHRNGAGSGHVLGLLENLNQRIHRASSAVTLEDVHNSGLNFETLKRFVNESTGGQGLTIEVVAYSPVVARTNHWLERTGYGFLKVKQHPKAALIEAFRNRVADIPRIKGITEGRVKELSDAAYPGLNKPHEIRLPIHPGDLERGSTNFRFQNYTLVGDEAVPSVDEEPLPLEAEPLPHEKIWYKRIQALRFGITLAVMGTATGTAAYLGDGSLTADAATVFLAGLGLEAQFIWLSKYWRYFWADWGFKGNALVNFSYGAILASVKHLTEFAQGMESTFDANDFLVRTAVLGATFIASFGGMQVVTAKMKEEGAYSEGRAMLIESVGNIINNFGRFFAITAGVVGSSIAVGSINGVDFGTNEAVGWAIQGGYLAFITSPLWFKRLIGDPVRAGLISFENVFRKDPGHPYNAPWLGSPLRWCSEQIAVFSRWLTPTRVKK